MDTLTFRPYLVQVEAKVDEHRLDRQADKDEYVRYVRRELAQRIAIDVEKEATYKTWYDATERVYKFRAAFYAIPQHKLKEMLEVDVERRVPVLPPVTYESSNVPETATDELVNIFSEAYDISFSDPDDTELPERRGLQAVLDHLQKNT